MKTGPIEKMLLKGIEKQGCIHLALIDPESPRKDLATTVRGLEDMGTSAIMVGGSTVKSPDQLDLTVHKIKENSSLPVILFPNGVSGISRYADAIFFMSLLNSSTTEFIIDIQSQGASLVRKYRLEPIPLGYLLVGDHSTSVTTVSRPKLVPYDESSLAVSYALAAQYLGMRFVYLEAGSGARRAVEPEMVHHVCSNVEIPVIVGGGIRTRRQAERITKAGASAIVTGTVLEQEGLGRIEEIVSAIKRVR